MLGGSAGGATALEHDLEGVDAAAGGQGEAQEGVRGDEPSAVRRPVQPVQAAQLVVVEQPAQRGYVDHVGQVDLDVPGDHGVIVAPQVTGCRQRRDRPLDWMAGPHSSTDRASAF